MIAAALLSFSLIDFSCQPATLSALRPRLEEVFQGKVAIGAGLEDEVIVVHASGVEPEVLREKIAGVVCGKWVEGPPGRWLLTLDKEEEQRRRDEVRGRYADAFKAYLASIAPKWGEAARRPWDAKQFAIDLATKEPNRLRFQFPADVIGMEIQARVPPDDFARAALGETIIYSNVSFPGSRPFSDGVDEVLRKRGMQGAELSKELAKFGWPEVRDREYSWIALRKQSFHRWPDEPIWALMRLGVREAYIGYGSMLLATMAGQIHQRPLSTTEVSWLFEDSLDDPVEGLYPKKYVSLHEHLLPPAREDVDEAGRSWADKKVVGSFFPSEPLAERYRDSWKAWAEAEKAPICISLPDRMMMDGSYSLDTFELLAEQEVEVVKAADGWIMGTPWLPWKARANRASRATIEKFNRFIAKGEFPPLLDQLRDKEWRQFFWRGLGGIGVSTTSHLSAYAWHDPQTNLTSDEVLIDLSSSTLLRAVEDFQGTLADIPSSDYEIIKNSVVKLCNWYRPEGVIENLNESEPAIVFGRSQASEFQLHLYLDEKRKEVLVAMASPEGGPTSFLLLSEESIAELTGDERASMVVLGEAMYQEINLVVTHASGYRARATMPIIESRWRR